MASPFRLYKHVKFIFTRITFALCKRWWRAAVVRKLKGEEQENDIARNLNLAQLQGKGIEEENALSIADVDKHVKISFSLR